MDIIKADKNSFEDVKKITHTTIMEIYPKYYPPGAVEFFLKHHSDESIVNDIEYGRTLLDFAEKEILKNYSFVEMDASLPAKL